MPTPSTSATTRRYGCLILTKIERIKEMEDLELRSDKPVVSEGIDANYMDIINYAVFGVIKLSEG